MAPKNPYLTIVITNGLVHPKVILASVKLRVIRKRLKNGNKRQLVDILEILKPFQSTFGVNASSILTNGVNHWKPLLLDLVLGMPLLVDILVEVGLLVCIFSFLPLGDRPFLSVTC